MHTLSIKKNGTRFEWSVDRGVKNTCEGASVFQVMRKLSAYLGLKMVSWHCVGDRYVLACMALSVAEMGAQAR